MFKLIRKIIKWLFRIIILIIVILLIVSIYRFLLSGITGQATNECKTLMTQDSGDKTLVYDQLANWLETQSTSIIKVKAASYQRSTNDIVVKYTIFNKLFSGQEKIKASSLDKICDR